MGNLYKINSLQNYTTRDDMSKLTFKKGDSFSAKILRLDGNSKDVVIKLLDGRVFPAKVEGEISQDKLDNYLYKFELRGFSGGKFELGIVEANLIENSNGAGENGVRDPLMDELLKNLDFPISKEDVPILKAMLKNNIPLTEENLLEIKGLNAFSEKAGTVEGQKQIEDFVNKFIEAKGININGYRGQTMKDVLKSFFNEISNFSKDDVLMMKSLGVKLTAEDVRAFAKVTSANYNVESEIKNTIDLIDKHIDGNNVKGEESVKDENLVTLLGKEENSAAADKQDAVKNLVESLSKEAENPKENAVNIEGSKSDAGIKDEGAVNAQKSEEKDVINSVNTDEGNSAAKATDAENDTLAKTSDKEVNPDKTVNKETEKSADNIDDKAVNNRGDKVEDKSEGNKTNNIVKDGEEVKPDSENNFVNHEVSEGKVSDKGKNILVKSMLAEGIKTEIKERLSMLKENIIELMKSQEKSPQVFESISRLIENKFQEFKMFNSINDNYYMLNLPINNKDDEYGCKMIIKDDRSKGKKIDSENIKIAASVDTVHMDIVDAFITINKSRADIEIVSSKVFTGILNRYKDNLMKDLYSNRYVFNIRITERKKEFSFVNCREFFEDTDFSIINTRV